ncbi:MAG: ferritin family protein [Desulfarculaceae bacterium]|nr:ferritin family protein [Desulfarculaceae bacterium]
MGTDFNANEIFEMARQIEITGAAFYREAAESVDNEDHKNFLIELAEMEDDHEKTFQEMQKELTDGEQTLLVFDPEDENALYLKALADNRVFSKKKKPGKDMTEILKSAIQTEKDSIVFYLGMKEMVPEKYGKPRINDIIKEEMSHLKLLSGKLKAVDKGDLT